MTIIWNGASYHKSQELKEYLELVNQGKSPEEWQVNCILFAPNARTKSSRKYLVTRKESLKEICLSL